MASGKIICESQRAVQVLALVFSSIALNAQNHPQLVRYTIVHGVVIDGISSQGIPNVYIRIHSRGVISDNNGNFSLLVAPRDTIRFSHIGYLPYQTMFNEDLNHDKFVVVLSPKITFLKEVTVTSLPTEMEFRNQTLETVPQLSMEEETANENIRVLYQASKFAMPLQMDSYQSYHEYIKGPQGVVLFSSNGSKGLVRAIKNVVRASPYKFPSLVNRRLGNHPKSTIRK